MQKANPEVPAVKERAVHCTIDTFKGGIAFGQHRLEPGSDPRDHYHLRLQSESDLLKLRSRYSLHKEHIEARLESHLSRLSRQGVLRRASIFFGVNSDPFFPFEGKFDSSMKLLKLFEKYVPGKLYIQTRSPLVVIGMPVLRKLGANVGVAFGVETCCEDSARRYTPFLPKIEERLKAMNALRSFGIEVTAQATPLLPYGDWRSDAPAFAELLARHADYVYVRPLLVRSEDGSTQIRSSPVAKLLADDRKFHWLRHDSANPLLTALESIAAHKLKIPPQTHLASKQVRMFAA